MATLSVDELREMSKRITRNPDSIYDLNPEETVAMRKYLNPLGNVISSKKYYINMGIINWREKYLRRLHMTALVGYLFRMNEEYTPDIELKKEKERYKAACVGLAGDELAALTAEHVSRNELIKSTAKGIINQFLCRNFEYNPDRHLRGSHSENAADPERKPKFTAIKETCKLAETAPAIETKLNARQEQTYKYLRSSILTTYNAAVETATTLKGAIKTIADPDLDREDIQGILFKKYKQLTDLIADMKKIVTPIASADTLDAWKVDPPLDVFHQFDRYLTNHYEQLRDVVQALYNEKSDFEFGVVTYEPHKTEQAAREYRVQHEAEFKTEVVAFETGAVTLLGPFKENRQRIDFYNKNTEVARRMMEQLEADHKLGKDLMEKELIAAKKKNIEEAGPDNPGLAAYKREMRIAQDLSGAKQVLSKEDKDKLAEAVERAQAIKEDYEVPDDGIQVNVFFPSNDSNNASTELRKTHFYTQAEAPLHLQEGSEFTDKYQPKRRPGDTVDTAYKTRVVTTRDGKKREIRAPKHAIN